MEGGRELILDDLCRLYDLKVKTGDVPPIGWSRQKIGWEFVIDNEGELVSVIPQGGKSGTYKYMYVPEHIGKTSGDKVYFLCDSAAILLGVGKEKYLREHQLSFEAHASFLSEVDDPAAEAVCKFLSHSREDESAADCGDSPDALAVFRLLGDEKLVHERSALMAKWNTDRTLWKGSPSGNGSNEGSCDVQMIQCSVTGRISRPAMNFRCLQGYPGTKGNGPSLVSFNKEAFCSYGNKVKDRTRNSSMTAEAAFKVGAALEYVSFEGGHFVDSGKDRLVFWTDSESPFDLNEIALFLGLDDFENRTLGEDVTLLGELHESLAAIRNGRPHDGVDASTRYYLMCITPNESRLSIRFYETSTLGDLDRHLAQYLRDTELVDLWKGCASLKPQPIRMYIRQTAALSKSDNVPETLVASTLRAMLRGEPFPHALYQQLIERMRVDKGYNSRNGKKREAMHLRVPMLKACLLRWARLQHDETTERSLTVTLNEDNDNRGYVLGRLFAALEKAQRDALGRNVNATIRDRYIGSASTTPARVFPQLLKLAQHHISKAEYGGAERAIESIMSKIDGVEGFPATLSLSEQGQFYIGYYQQKAAFWTKKDAMREEN